MARGKQTSDEVRAAVMAALLAGDGVNEISRRLQLPKATVSRIRNEVAPERLEQLEPETTAKIDVLLSDYLESNLRALKAICEQVHNQKWISEQSATQVAELHNELATTALRLFEAQPVTTGSGEP